MFRTVLSFVALAFLIAAHPALAQQTPQPARARSTAKPAVAGTVNINTASATDLEVLPGVGAKTAVLIVEYRQKNGPFKKIEELMNVRGIGERNFLKLKGQITVAPVKADHHQQ